jgi:hypothetical protein
MNAFLAVAIITLGVLFVICVIISVVIELRLLNKIKKWHKWKT